MINNAQALRRKEPDGLKDCGRTDAALHQNFSQHLFSSKHVAYVLGRTVRREKDLLAKKGDISAPSPAHHSPYDECHQHKEAIGTNQDDPVQEERAVDTPLDCSHHCMLPVQ